MEKNNTCEKCENIFAKERVRVKRFREQAEEERQAGTQGQWQLESPGREYLEQVKCCNDTDCTHRMMKQGFVAMKSGDWEEYENTFRKEVKVSEWAFDRMKEAFEKVAKDEAKKAEQRPSNHDKKHRLRATHHRVSGEARRRHDVKLVPAL